MREATVSLLYGTRLSSRELPSAVSRTIFSKLDSAWEHGLQEIMRRPTLVDRISRWMFTAGDYGREMVESMETPEARKSLEDPQQSLPALFHKAKHRGPSELSQEWLEGLTRSLLDSEGWFTVPRLHDYVQAETQKILQTSESFPQIFNDHYDYELPGDMHVSVPSRPILRGIAERLAAEGEVLRSTWVKEIGRPAIVFYLPGRLPFHGEDRCGQCAFYVPLRRQCRIWWLLNRSYTSRHERWTRDGAHPLSAFDLHKMRNAWRIGPHSSACAEFIDKKKDHTLKEFPKLCDVCGEGLPAPPQKTSMVVCKRCRTRYFMLRQRKVQVLTSYEHEFERRYKALAGVEPASDINRLIEESRGSAPRIVEQAIYDEHRRSLGEDPDSTPKTVMLFQGENMLAREGRLYIFKRRRVESVPLAGSTLVDLGHAVSEEQRGILESAGMTVRSASGPAESEGREGSPLPRYDISRSGEGRRIASRVLAEDGPCHGPERDTRHRANRPRGRNQRRCHRCLHEEAEAVAAPPRA